MKNWLGLNTGYRPFKRRSSSSTLLLFRQHDSPSKRLLQGSISLLLALFTLGVGILGVTYLRLADLRRADYLLAVLAAEQSDAVLSCYEREIFKRYGIMAFREDTPDRLGLVTEKGRLEGEILLEQTPGQALPEGPSLRGQILDFMQLRLPAKVVDRWRNYSRALDEANGEVTLTLEDQSSLQEEHERLLALGGVSEFDKEEMAADGPADELGPDSVSGANDVLAQLEEDGQTLLAYDMDRGVLRGQSTDVAFLIQLLEGGDRLTHSKEKPVLEDFKLSEYALGMFPSFTHGRLKHQTPYSSSLRGDSLAGSLTSGRADLEYLVFGHQEENANVQAARGLVFTQRYLLRVGDYYRSAQKMGRARAVGTAVSLMLLTFSGGTVSVDAEMVARLIWLLESAADAAGDCQLLYEGGAVPLRPYTDEIKTQLYYQDHLRLPLLFMAKDELLSRMGRIMERDAGANLYTGIHIRLDWTGAGETKLRRQITNQSAYPFGRK